VDEEEQNFARIWSGTSPRLFTLDVTSAIEQNLLRFLPENDMPARLEKVDAVDHQIKAPASLEGDGLTGRTAQTAVGLHQVRALL